MIQRHLQDNAITREDMDEWWARVQEKATQRRKYLDMREKLANSPRGTTLPMFPDSRETEIDDYPKD
jgi:hypothetical protein